MVQLATFALLVQEGGFDLDFLERNRHIIYPAVGVLVIILLGASVISAWRTPKVEGAEKARLKGEVIRAMRQNIGWITAAELAERLDVDLALVVQILTEMKEEDVVVSATIQNLVNYRLRGI
ncbi:MAG: hypothetical protein P1V51_12755 [Deltaproteobacteria bacterium]|nr:hypothetical protein [Deltaproteobacteria bacterium]